MNNKEFLAELAERTGYAPRDAQRLVNNLVFETKKKMERVMVNPSTGQRMLVPPKLVLNFKPNQTWRDKLKGGQ